MCSSLVGLVLNFWSLFGAPGWLEDLKHANEMAVDPPGWEAPCFKGKLPAARRLEAPADAEASKVVAAFLDVAWRKRWGGEVAERTLSGEGDVRKFF